MEAVPNEIWLLRYESGNWVPADEGCDVQPLLACLSEADAQATAEYLSEKFCLECKPVRVL